MSKRLHHETFRKNVKALLVPLGAQPSKNESSKQIHNVRIKQSVETMEIMFSNKCENLMLSAKHNDVVQNKGSEVL